MEEPKQPYHYTAGDLERYISGQMSRNEMYLLEKAALDDPFLAEALEGMMSSGGDEAWKDIGELKENLRIRIEGPQQATGPGGERSTPTAGASDDAEAQVYPMRPSTDIGASAPRIGWRSWRIAASIGLLIGLGLLTTWIVQRQSTDDKTIASRVAPKNENDTAAAASVAETEGAIAPVTAMPDSQALAAAPSAPASTSLANEVKKQSSSDPVIKDSPLTVIAAAPVTTTPAEQSETDMLKAAPPVASADTRSREALPGAASENRARAVPSASGKITGPFVYTGQVRSTEGQPLSFVNIRLEPAGTSQYTDARGQFRIMSADSNLTLQLNAYGYAKKSAQLQARQQNKPLTFTMQPASDKAKAKTAPKPKASSREEMTKLDETISDTAGIPEAEPRDGWAAYSQYLLNNVRMPQDAYQQKLHGTVYLSFMVDAYGRLSDFRVEKSLSPSCDREAIRLVREGPPWDLYNSDRPLRARVTVIF